VQHRRGGAIAAAAEYLDRGGLQRIAVAGVSVDPPARASLALRAARGRSGRTP